MDDNRDAYGSETYGHGEVENYVEPRRPQGPNDAEVHRALWAQLWKRVALAALVAALAFMVAAGAYNAFVLRQQQTASAQRLKVIQATAADAKRATERIEDCTTPGSGCFEQGQKRSAELVSGLNDTSTRAASAAAACADQPDRQTYKQILTCVTAALKADRTRPKAAP